MPKKHILKPEIKTEFSVIGITCQYPIYRFAHFLNKKVQFNLVRLPDIDTDEIVTVNSGKHSIFSGILDDYSMTFCLAANKGAKKLLFKNLKNTDYLLFLIDITPRYLIEQLVKKIRSIKGVVIAYNIDKNSLSEIDQIIRLIELHLHEHDKIHKP